jgi:hypothetical protein
MIQRLVKPPGGIDTIDNLRRHLQVAIEIEHSVIPPYLCALYSIVDGTNSAAVEAIRDVVVEEMLHLTLAANVLNSIGGSPDLVHAKFVPAYPCYLPHGNDSIVLNLAPFSREAVAGFLAIEHPSAAGAPPEAHHYATIGQFYEAIIEGIERLAKKHPRMFSGKRSRQITPEYYYNSGGSVVVVSDLKTAKHALEKIIIEGEGRNSIYDRKHPPRRTDSEELAHYYRFLEIQEGRRFRKSDTPKTGPTGDPVAVDWTNGIYPMQINPHLRDYPPGSPLYQASMKFNQEYSALLRGLHRAFNGEPAALLESVPLMFRLKYAAQGLMKTPAGRGNATAGPTFEFV